MSLFDTLTKGPLGPLAAGLGVILTRTTFIQMNSPSGIPIPLIVFDVINEERPRFRADVTEHPVEAGTEVSDHIQLKNDMLSLKGKFSNTPLDASIAISAALSGGIQAFTNPQARSNLLNTGLSQVKSIVGAALMGGSGDPLSAGIAGALDALSRTILITTYQNKTPFNVVTKRQTFTSMIIEDLSFPRTESTGFALDFEIQLKKVRIVSPLKVQKTQVSESVIPGASSATNLGSQATAQASPQMQGQVGSSNASQGPGMSRYA